MPKTLKKMFFALESDVANMLLNIETLQHIQVELAKICREIEGAKFKDVLHVNLSNYSTLFVLDELLFYTVNDLKENYEAAKMRLENIMALLEGDVY